MTVISVEDFEGLDAGDALEVGSAFKPLTKEPVVLRVASRTADAVSFDLLLFGINLGKAECVRKGEDLVWAAA